MRSKILRTIPATHSLLARTVFALGVMLLWGAPLAIAVGAQADEKVYTPAEGATAPVLISTVDAVYPSSVRDDSKPARAVVVVDFVVGADGTTRDIHVERSLGPDVDRNVLDAVRQYRFRPGRYKGKPVAVRVKMESVVHKN